MTQLPHLAIRVKNTTKSLAFYTNYLGFTPGNAYQCDLAEIIDNTGDHILLIGPTAVEVEMYLDERHAILEPGEKLLFPEDNLDAWHAQLKGSGLTQLYEKKTSWGDRFLTIRDPDGYLLSFYTRVHLSQEEVLAMFVEGVDELATVLTGLTEQELDLKDDSEVWSIRMIVHHVVDGDQLWLPGIRAALVSPGCHYSHDWYTNDTLCAEQLNYAGRPVDMALSLFRINRAYLHQLLYGLSGAWERYVLFKRCYAQEAEKMTVGSIIRMRAVHALEHADEIREIRRKYGLV